MVTLSLIFNEINKNDSQRQVKIKPEFIKIESNASVIKLNSVRHLEMMINGSQWILKKGENFSNENNSVEAQFLLFAKSQSVQRKGRNLNNITIQQHSTKYGLSSEPPSTETHNQPGVPRKVDYTSVWVGFGVWLVIVVTTVIVAGYKVFIKSLY